MLHAIRRMKTAMIMLITYQIEVALAQVALMGCLPSSKDQTRRGKPPIYIASMMALKVSLGRIALVANSSSGR